MRLPALPSRWRCGRAASRGARLLALLVTALVEVPDAIDAQAPPPRDTAAVAAADSARRVALRDSLRAVGVRDSAARAAAAVRDSARADSTHRLMLDRMRARPVPLWLWLAVAGGALVGVVIVIAAAQGLGGARVDSVVTPAFVIGALALVGAIFLGGIEFGARRAVAAALAVGRVVPPAELPATWPASAIALLFGVLAAVATACFFGHASRGSWIVESHWGGFGNGGGGMRVSATVLYFVAALVFSGLALVVGLRPSLPASVGAAQSGAPTAPTPRPTPAS